MIKEFDAKGDLSALTTALDADGAAIVHNLVPADQLAALNTALDPLVEAFTFQPRGHEIYDEFAGHQTVRLQSMLAKCPETEALIAQKDVLAATKHMLAPKCSDFILSTAELIEIAPGETAQMLHRDQDVWTEVAKVGEAILASCIIALTPFTQENGGTQVVPGSHNWDVKRQALPEEIAYCEMPAGAGLVFRGDTLHGGGENTTQERRRCLATSYVVGWLRPFENAQLATPVEIVRTLTPEMQALLGYKLYEGKMGDFSTFGWVDYDDPAKVL